MYENTATVDSMGLREASQCHRFTALKQENIAALMAVRAVPDVVKAFDAQVLESKPAKLFRLFRQIGVHHKVVASFHGIVHKGQFAAF